MKTNLIAIIFALLAALFYGAGIPFSKILLSTIPPTFLASFLYLGAGFGIGVIYALNFKKQIHTKRLEKVDLPYILGMIILDIIAPILLMFGILKGSGANAALLSNFEIVATTLIALAIFKEFISFRLWVGIILICLSSVILSFESAENFVFSIGSLLVIMASICWGFENNCTRKISHKNTYEIVTLKGIFSGLGAFLTAVILGESLPEIRYIATALILGFFAYGLSIFLYIKAQKYLGAAKTSAYYATTPFIGAALSLMILQENLSEHYFLALAIMLLGSCVVVYDTLITDHSHAHTHVFTHTHGGDTHTHTITHSHHHEHGINANKHSHTHKFELNLHENLSNLQSQNIKNLSNLDENSSNSNANFTKKDSK